MSHALPLPSRNYEGGHCLRDKRRKLCEDHAGDSVRRLPDEVLDRLSSQTIEEDAMTSSQRWRCLLTQIWNLSAGDCHEDKKRKSCQEHTGDLLNKISDEALENMFSSLAIQEDAVASSGSSRPEHFSKQNPRLVLNGYNVLEEGNSDHMMSTNENDNNCRSLRSDEFINRVNDLLLRHQGTGIQLFVVHFDLNSSHAAHLDKRAQFASEAHVQDVVFYLYEDGRSGSQHLGTASRYEFPLQYFGDGQGSSLRRLCLSNCIFRPPLYSSGLSSLVFLMLKLVSIADSDIQNIFSCFPGILYLRLGHCEDLIDLRISHEQLLYLDIDFCNKLKSIELHSTNLGFFEYNGPKVCIKYASTPNISKIVTKFEKTNSSLPKELHTMKMLHRANLSFLSSTEEPSFIQYKKKFTALQHVSLHILTSWNNVLGVAFLLKATPYVRRLHLEALSGQHHYSENVEVNWPELLSLKKLRTIIVGGFAAQSPLMELLGYLMSVTTGLRFLQIDPHYHRPRTYGLWRRDENIGDEAARDLARNAARAAIGPKLPSSVKFVVK